MRRLRAGLGMVSVLGISVSVAALTGCDSAPFGGRESSISAAAPQPGDELVPFRVVAALTKDTLVVGGGSEPGSLLMYAATTCAACDISLPLWRRLVESHAARLRMVRLFLPTDDVIRMTEVRRPNETIASIAGAEVVEVQRRLQLDMTPTFILVAPRGQIARIVVGRLTSTRVEQLRDAMDSLSGVHSTR